MGSFGDLLYDLSTSFGSGMEKGMAEQRGEATTVRKEKRAQKTQIEAEERAQAGQIADEERKRILEMADREDIYQLLGPTLEAAMPPVTSAEVAPEATAEVLRERPVTETRPYKIKGRPPVAAYGPLYTLLGKKQAQPRDRAHQPYDDAYRRVREAGGSLQEAEEAGRKAAAEASGLKTGANVKATLAQPPEISPTERGQLAGAEAIRQMAGDIYSQFEGGGRAFVNPWMGGEGATSMRRLLPGAAPSLKEERMRTSVNKLFNHITRLEAGLTQSQSEELRQYRVLPTMGTTPEKFQANLEGAVDYANRLEQTISGQVAQPRGRGATGQGKVIKDYGGGYILRSR